MNYNLDSFEDKNIVFIGRGKEGSSFERFIRENSTIRDFLYVDKADGPDYLDNLIELDLKNTIVVKTPGCPGKKVPVPYTTPTIIFFDCVKQLGAKTIGITGTKGKTTTSSMVAFMLKNNGLDVKLCGNIGSPALDALKEAKQKDIFVIELSSFQLAELKQSPDIAILTNLYRDHIDYHGSLEAYWESKQNIMRFMNEDGVFIYNPHTILAAQWCRDNKTKGIAINPNEKIDMSKTKLIGDHNRLNFLMARTAAELLGVDRRITTLSLDKFEPIRHRLQPIKTIRDITFVDDAIGSNPDATIAGIKALMQTSGPIGCLMLGGVDRDYNFSELIQLVSQIDIPNLILFPDTGSIIKQQLPKNYTPEILETEDMVKAVSWAAKKTPAGSVCLLSTAAPSTVLWSNFEEKGNIFQKAVLNLPS